MKGASRTAREIFTSPLTPRIQRLEEDREGGFGEPQARLLMTIPSGAWHRPSLQDREPRAPAYVVPGLHQSGSTARLGSDEGGKQDAEVNPKKEVGKHGIGVDVYHRFCPRFGI